MSNITEKVVYGSKFNILAFNGSASIPILYGGHILITEEYQEILSENDFNLRTEEEITSITITIQNADWTLARTYNFSLASGQVLSGDDYIDSQGLHINGNTIAFTSQQEMQFKALQNISLYEGINHIKVSDQPPAVLKFSYSSIEEENPIYVLNKNEQLLAVFNKDDDETLINPRIEKKQNSESVFTFTIDIKNPKWEEINNPENLYLVDGMIFSTNFDGSFKENITENDEQTVEVTAYERQQLLTRKYVRAWNSETGLEKIDTFMVVILSNGNLPLKNNGIEVTPRYPKGSSGYVLEGLLYGTGWTVGTCDIYEYENGELVLDDNNNPVYLKFDFETDQMNIYDNILKIQELWGGILIFDSMNKVVHHRDETIYLPYNGYEVKYEKNMQSLEKQYNNKIITKLCPLGEGGLNIKNVNNNSVWLENYSYTNTVLEGIENNPDITDSTQLKKWGERKLEMLCRPSIELDVKVALLYQVEGYELETIDLNHIVRVIGYEKVLPSLLVGETTIIGENAIIGGSPIQQLRVVEFSYYLWDKSDANIKLSNITLDSTDIFRKTIIATNSINTGTLDAAKVTTLYKGGESVETTMYNMNSEVAGKVGSNEIVPKINSAIEEGQGVIHITGNQVTIESDNFELDREGNLTCKKAILYGDDENTRMDMGDGITLKGFYDKTTETGNLDPYIKTVHHETIYEPGASPIINEQETALKAEGIFFEYSDGENPNRNKNANIIMDSTSGYIEATAYGMLLNGNKVLTNIAQSVLWSGAIYMNGSQTANLTSNISDQPNGIVLVWSDYSNGQANDWNFNFTFIPKNWGSSGIGMVCQLVGSKFTTIGTKYLYIYDNRIVGNADNAATGTNNGITYANNRFVLRRIVGV